MSFQNLQSNWRILKISLWQFLQQKEEVVIAWDFFANWTLILMKILKQSASRRSTWLHFLVLFASIFCIDKNQKFVLLNIHLGNGMQHIFCLHWPLCYLPGLDSRKGRETQKIDNCMKQATLCILFRAFNDI